MRGRALYGNYYCCSVTLSGQSAKVDGEEWGMQWGNEHYHYYNIVM